MQIKKAPPILINDTCITPAASDSSGCCFCTLSVCVASALKQLAVPHS